MEDCVFCKIVVGELPCKKVWEDTHVLAFTDLHPVAETHVLFVPKKHVNDFSELHSDEVMASLRTGVREVVEKHHLMGKGYKVQVNGGGAQIIPHLHFHLVGPIGEAVEL